MYGKIVSKPKEINGNLEKSLDSIYISTNKSAAENSPQQKLF